MYMRHCSWNPEAAAQYATKHAERKSVGFCAHYVRKALITGGIPLYYAFGAATKDYKHNLLVLDVDRIKFENRPEDFQEVIDKIDAELFGLFPSKEE
jgi:hypothetical protein